MSKILIVDDDQENREIVRVRLELAGYQVDEATNGEEALAYVQNTPPDLIILDVMMPKMDGWNVCRTLKGNALTRKIPIVMLTACSKQIEEMRSYESGADDFLTKPWDPENLKQVVEKWLTATIPKALMENH